MTPSDDWASYHRGMEARIDLYKISSEPVQAMLQMEKYLHHCSIETPLLHLIKLRASQINGCAYCLDMHSKDLLAIGETPQRLVGLDAWREAPYYTDRERAALEWTEAITRISESHADDAVYERVKQRFSDKELADLTWAIATINVWNRMAIAFRSKPGMYQPPKRSGERAVV